MGGRTVSLSKHTAGEGKTEADSFYAREMHVPESPGRMLLVRDKCRGSLLAALLMSVAGCTEITPAGIDAIPRADDPDLDSDGVSVEGARYPFTAAVGEIWGKQGRYDTHFNVDFTLTDGQFAVTPIVVDGIDASVREPVDASAVLTAELYAAGAIAFPFADYDYVATPDVSPSIAGRHFFINGRLGVDSDLSGDVDADETHDVIDGAIDFEGPLPDISLTFTLVLANGMIATGRYGGLFEFIQPSGPRQ